MSRSSGRACGDAPGPHDTGGDMTAAVSGRCLQFRVPATAAAVALARGEVAAQLGLWGLPGQTNVAQVAVLAVSELVTNTVRHAATAEAAQVRLGLDAGQLTLAVHDRDPRMPRRVPCPAPEEEGGRGLALVQALAAEAGGQTAVPRDADGLGKTVTVRLPV
ncbi:ATP-binding protein [Streptomyces olivoreticuli]|uniref:ATP-binding protein n=1 Tax=Streptomyces olivoreticuli TaxID=68246 RepID=UPI002658EFAF|nr:ATP-binding protein [Streptomyces olivoreticuli]WKK21907.1 ATP-binding protein [Streptomyces olivoreticuli]WKK26937.1 ATP-binding protein [Streptomyces olivoreticuli]